MRASDFSLERLGTRGRLCAAVSSDEAEDLLPCLPSCMLGTSSSFFSDLDFFFFLAVLVDDLGSATGEGGAADADAFERSVWTPFPLA